MARVSISEAARLTGKSRTTLHRLIKAGDLSTCSGERKSSEVSTIFALRSPLQVDRSPALINLCSVVLLLPVSRAASLIDTTAQVN